MDLRLYGKNALVTGGTRGIGRATVLALAREGANVVTCYRSSSEDVVAGLERELKETDGYHQVVKADVTSESDVDTLMEECQNRLGSLDIVVSNAGVISHVPFRDLPADEWSRVVDTTLTGAFRVVQKALPLMWKDSSVILVGSRVATVGLPLRAHYTAAKAGLLGLGRSLAKELGPKGIRVNVVAPGVIETEEAASYTPEQRAAYEKRYHNLTALGRFGTPDDIAGAVLFLSSPLSTYVTGETLHVDGGI